MTTEQVLISLSANLGDRKAAFDRAIEHLREEVNGRLLATSSYYETCAYYVTDQPDFFNAAVLLEMTHSPQELLAITQGIEKKMGRIPRGRWQKREIDLNIILFGDRMVKDDNLHIPHPLFRERTFVLEPCAQIAPDLRDPETGLTMGELWTQYKASL